MSQFYRSSQISSNSAFEERGNDVHKIEESSLESKFDFLSKNIRIFCAITRHLADIRARNMKVLEKLTDHSYRKFAFTQLATQASICFDLLRELYATVKNPDVCVILLETSRVIQKKMSILDDFFSGITEYDKDLEKEYLKEIIEYFNSIKEPQITQLSAYIDQLKIQLNTKSSSCHQKSQYERDLYMKTAKPLFKLKKPAFSKYIQTKSRPSTQTVSEAVRVCRQESGHGKYLERRTPFPANIESQQMHEVKEKKPKPGNIKTHEIDCSSTKENNNAASNCIPEKERRLSGDLSINAKESFNKNCKSNDLVIEKKITNSADNKSSLENVPLSKDSNYPLNKSSPEHVPLPKSSSAKSSFENGPLPESSSDPFNKSSLDNVLLPKKSTDSLNKISIENGSLPKNSRDFLNIFTMNNRLTNNHINANKYESEGYQNSHAKKNKLCEDEDINRTLRFAKVFCSRSIKSSSNGKNMKRFENLIKFRMHTVLPMIKEGRCSEESLSRKRKRTVDAEIEMPSDLKNATLGSEEKRVRYEMTTVA